MKYGYLTPEFPDGKKYSRFNGSIRIQHPVAKTLCRPRSRTWQLWAQVKGLWEESPQAFRLNAGDQQQLALRNRGNCFSSRYCSDNRDRSV